MERAKRYAEALQLKAGHHGWVLTYRLNVAEVARQEEDVDVALAAAGGHVIHDGALLWRPLDLAADVQVTVRWEVPRGIGISVPWEPQGELQWWLDGERLEGGAYVFVGALEELGSWQAGTWVHAAVAKAPRAASKAGLRRWVEESAAMVATYSNGALPVTRTQVVLLPVPSSKESGVFGAAMRRGHGSIVLFFGAEAEDAQFPGEWVAPHELLHLTNPRMKERVTWFTEGLTTYSTDLVRARAGAREVEQMWMDIRRGTDETCGRDQAHSLRAAAVGLAESHAYRRVYWGGACAMFVVDVALREMSNNLRDLDQLMAELRALGVRRGDGLDEETVTMSVRAALKDSPWGAAWFDAALGSPKGLPVDELYDRLGVVRSESGKVVLDDGAPWAAVRRSMMGESGASPPLRVSAVPGLSPPPALSPEVGRER
jgi:hypothetical protein